MATKNEIQEIKERLDIVNVISQYVPLKKTGRNWTGLCPFHGEKTPSFHVNPQLGVWKCFGCGKFGDVIEFVKEIEHSDFNQAIEKLASQAGVTLSHDKNEKEFKLVARIRQMNEQVADLYHYMLTKHELGRFALTYAVEKRKLVTEVLDKYKIGYAPKKFTLVQDFLRKKGYTEEEINAAGLLNDKNSDKFVNRLMFSLFDSAGNIVGFSGRVIEKDDPRPKYLNSPETPVFKKRFLLFGLYHGKEEIIRKDSVIICEGQIDVISSHQAGVKNIVAPLGTGLTESQLVNVGKLTKNVAFAFDNDAAGQNSTVRGVEIAMSVGMRPFIIMLPQTYKDIDELVQQDPATWKYLAEHPQDYFEVKVADLQKLMKSDFEQFEKKLSELLHTISFAPDLKRSLLVKDLSQKLAIDEATLLSAVTEKKQVTLQQEGIQQRQGALTTVEYLLSLMLNFPILAVIIGSREKSERFFITDMHKKLYNAIYDFVDRYKDQFMPKKKSDLEEKGWIIRNTEFNGLIGDSYAKHIQEVQVQDADLAELILRLGTNKDTFVPDLSDSILKDFLASVRRLKKSIVTMEIQKLQEQMKRAEMQKDKETVKVLSNSLQELISQLRPLEGQ